MNKYKQILPIFILLSTTVGISGYAATPATDLSNNTNLSVFQKAAQPTNITPEEIQKQTKALVKEARKIHQQTDEVLAALLAIPYEKRQYFYPYLHEEPYMPHKIKSHPQILAWKGKRPTVIAPQLKEFAQKHLDNLPAAFYYFLDPDFFVQIPPMESTMIPDMMNINSPQMQVKSKLEIANYAVRDLTKSYVISPDIAKNYNKTSLTEQDVQRFTQTLNQLTDFIDSYPEGDYIPSELRDLIGQRLPETAAAPFVNWVHNIHLTKIGKDFDEFIKKAGWKDADEFAQKADIMLRALRVNRMSLIDAMAMSKLRQTNLPDPDKPMSHIQMYLLMYESHPGDALFFAPYTEEMKKTFDKHNFMRIGLPIHID